MECLDANLIQGYLEGGLAPDERSEVAAHVEACGTCRSLITQLGTAPTLADSPRAQLVRPTKIDRYEVTDTLGEGGMGIVYAAFDPELHREIAVKLLRPSGSAESDTAGARSRLLREAQAMARVTHPNVIAVYDVGTWEGQVFIAMELAPKGTLRRWQRERDWREIVAAYVSAGRGLAAAHAANLAHRDFKPDNVLVGADDRMRVTDFGLARAQGAQVEHSAAASGILGVALTQTGAVMGTPAYMAPEQIAGEPSDARGDQFAFCVALWEALYRKRPFAGASLTELGAAIDANAIAAPPKSLVPGAIERALRRGLAANPAARWPTMDALLAELAPVRPRRALVAIPALVAIAVVIALLSRSRGAAPVACDMPHVPIALSTQIAAFTPAFVQPRVTAWIAAWSNAATASCSDSRQLRCFDNELDELDAQLERWRLRRQLAAEDAHDAVDALPLPSRCSKAMLHGFVEPPAEELAAVASAQYRFARAHESGPALRALLPDVRATGYTPLYVDVAIELASAERGPNRDSALATARDAIAMADLAGAEVPRILARFGLLVVLGADNPEEQARLVEAAHNLIDQIGGDAELASTLDYLVGESMLARGHETEAITAFARAASGFRTVYGPDSQHEETTLISLMGAYAKQDPNGPDAHRIQQQALAIAHRTGTENLVAPITATTGSIGADPQSLVRIGQQLLAQVEEVGDPAAIFDAENNLGLAYYIADDIDDALVHLQTAAELADKRGIRNEHAGDANVHVADWLVERDRTNDAMVAAKRAIAIAEAIHDDREIAYALTALGNVQLASNHVAAARPTLERALNLLEQSHASAALRGEPRFLLAVATWPIDHARAIDLAHAARVDTQAMVAAIPAGDPSGPWISRRAQKKLAKIDNWLATHR